MIASSYRSVPKEEHQADEETNTIDHVDIEDKGNSSSSASESSSADDGDAAIVNENSWLQLQQQQQDKPTDGKDETCHDRQRQKQLMLLRQARILLYVSHFFAQFAEGAWQYAVILFMAAVTHYQSILWVSTYYLATYAAVLAGGTSLGQYVDRANRWTAARLCILIQNGSVLLATVCCCWLLTRNEHRKDDHSNDSGGDDGDDEYAIPKDTLSIVLLVGIHLFGSVAQVLSQAFVVAIERDWIVVLSQTLLLPGGEEENDNESFDDEGENKLAEAEAAAESWLSATNVALRQIDLTCKVLAPAVAGFVVGQVSSSSSPAVDTGISNDDTRMLEEGQYHHHHNIIKTLLTDGHGALCDLHGASIMIGFVNVTALLVEYVCTAKVYNLIPELAIQQKHPDHHQKQEQPMENDQMVFNGEQGPDRNEKSGTYPLQSVNPVPDNDDRLDDSSETYTTFDVMPIREHRGLRSLWHGLAMYLDQSVVWAGLSLAILNLNAMSFGGIMTAFLLEKGMSVEEVGLWRSIASITGLLGTFAYQLSTKYTTVVNTGELSALYLFVCLTLAVVSFVFPDNYFVSTYLLVVSLAISRTGLWVFDITVTLLYQQYVPDGIRGLVGGTQQALNSFFVVLVSSLGLFFQRPQDFYIFGAASYLGICTCAVMYTFGVFRRGHLFPMASGDGGGR